MRYNKVHSHNFIEPCPISFLKFGHVRINILPQFPDENCSQAEDGISLLNPSYKKPKTNPT